MNVLTLFKDILPAAVSAIDKVTTSSEERGRLKLELIQQQMRLAERLIDAQVRVTEAQAKIIATEAGGGGLKASWRPISALAFVGLIIYKIAVEPFCIAYIDGFPTIQLPGWIGATLATMFGGYVVGRSAEKVTEMLTRYDPDIFEKAKDRIKLGKTN